MSAIHNASLFDARDAEGHTLLFHAVSRGNDLLASELLKLGADPNLADPFGWTPFHEAVRTENTLLAKQLVSHGGDALATVSDIDAYSAPTSSHGMFYQDDGAAAINSLHIAAGVDPHPMDSDARKILSAEMVRLLLELGLDPNSKTKNTAGLEEWDWRNDETPLQIIFRKFPYGSWDRKFFEVVQTLVDAGADVTGIADGLKPMHVARFEGYEDLWEVFRTDGTAVEAGEGVVPS
jgi:ankyrin repeat protein